MAPGFVAFRSHPFRELFENEASSKLESHSTVSSKSPLKHNTETDVFYVL